MSKQTNAVQQSTQYDKFKFLLNNREANRGHIELLKKSFEEVGNLTAVQPILVNDKFEIIDGQHRFVACRELNLPVFYTQVAGLTVDDARKMNILHKGWTVDDYARSYALGGKKNYQTYLSLREEYPTVSHTQLLLYVYPEYRNGIFADFRNGDLEIEDLGAARDMLDKLVELQEALDNRHNGRAFQVAFRHIVVSPYYNHGHMMKKAKTVGTSLPRLGQITDYALALENLYNHSVSKKNHVRLY
jgi:hypothetical protein